MGHKIKRIITDNLLFLVIALLPYAGIPAIVNAQQGSAPELFTEPLSVLRGKITPQSGLAEVWPKDFYCDIVKRDWGWSSCEGFDAFIDLSTISSSRIVPKCPTSPPTKRWITDIIPW